MIDILDTDGDSVDEVVESVSEYDHPCDCGDGRFAHLPFDRMVVHTDTVRLQKRTQPTP